MRVQLAAALDPQAFQLGKAVSVMKVVDPEIWVCPDCLIWLVNGDASGIESDERVARVQAGEQRLGRHIVPNYDSETCDGIEDFSTRDCECCQDAGHGSRHRMARLGEKIGQEGCLADSYFGHEHVRQVLAKTVDCYLNNPELVSALRGEPSDDYSEEHEAIDALNEYAADEGLRFELVDGDLMVLQAEVES